MYKEAVIYFKNGHKDWISPIMGEESIKYYDNLIIVSNDLYSYDYNKSDVDKIEIVEIE